MNVFASEEPLRLDLGCRSYDIHVGPHLLARAGSVLRPLLPQPRLFLVTDETVAQLHLPALKASLQEADIAFEQRILPPGESTKSFAQLECLLESMLAAGCERGTAVLAFGGGVIGDVAGFAASILLRGVPYVQVPTTLLAQVDSSVGGKTGINARHGKNLVGAFYQPRLVLADTALLATLPLRQMRAGYAEVVKYGLIDDAAFFAWLEQNGPALLAGEPERLRTAVRISCQAKARIVGADERESDIRALLNLGHTFAHALEAETGFGTALLHGEAVAIGMVLAFDLSARLGLCPTADAVRLRRHLVDVGLPVSLPPHPGTGWTTGRLVEHMAHDKKVKDGRIGFVLARGIGQTFLGATVPMEAVRALLDDAIAGTEGSAHGGGAAA